MNAHSIRSRIALFATPVAALALGFTLQACGGAPDSDPSQTASAEQTAQTQDDLSILGIKLPEPTVSFGLGDAGITINPIGTIDTLIPEQGIKLPDPITPVNQILGAVGKGASATVSVGDLNLSLKLPGIELPKLPDPLADAGGITIIGR